MCLFLYKTIWYDIFDQDHIQTCQLSCGVREILEVHTQLLEQLEIVQAKWEEVRF